MDLAELIAATKGDRSYDRLASLSGDVPGAKRWQQLATSTPKNFVDPPTVRGIARALGVTELQVVIANARSLGLDVRSDEPRLFALLPAQVRNLTDDQVAAVRSVVLTMLTPTPDIRASLPTTDETLDRGRHGAPDAVAAHIASDPSDPEQYTRAAFEGDSRGRQLRDDLDEEQERGDPGPNSDEPA